MFARRDTAPTPHVVARITESTFLRLLWAGTGISLCFLLFRIFVRLNAFRRLYSDDFLVITAWASLLGTSILWQIRVPLLYEYYAVMAGNRPYEASYIDKQTIFLRTMVPLSILFYSSLWLVKVSFLMFFSRLGWKVKGPKIWWRCILIVTVLTWVACIATIDYQCLLNSVASITPYCASLKARRYENSTFYANCASDVVTDCLIISIPTLMLWHVRISLRQKSMLIGIFSVTAVVMIVAIIRVTTVNSINGEPDYSWLYFWSNIEMATSIIIACIASFRQLFVTNQNQHQRRRTGQLSTGTTRRNLFHYFGSSRGKGKASSKVPGPRIKWATIPTIKGQSLWDRLDSKTQIASLDGVPVSQDISISGTLQNKRV